MAKNKNKGIEQDEKAKKVAITIFGVGIVTLFSYYINERIKIAKQVSQATQVNQSNQNNNNPPQDQNGNGINMIVCKGDKKNEVRILQSYLKYVKGQDIGRFGVDGDWGNDTQIAVNNVFSNKPTCFNQNAIDTFRIAYQGM